MLRYAKGLKLVFIPSKEHCMVSFPCYSNSSKGVSLMQAMIGIALVGVACIMALQTLGGSVMGGFGSISAGLPGQAAVVPKMQDNAQSNSPAVGTPTVQVAGLNTGTQMGFTSNIASAVETVGANGTVNGLLENLKAQAAYFKSTGQISETQYTDLMSLVSQGYRMADAQKAVETAIANSGNDSAKFAAASVMFEGKSYTVDELREQFGVAPNYRIQGTMFENFLASKNSMTSTISDPKAKQVVTVLADQILSVSNAFEGSIGMSTLGYDSTTDTIFKHTASVDSLNELAANGIVSTSWDTPLPDLPSTFTKNNSSAICKVGQVDCKL